MNGELVASDAERERTVAQLREHVAEGRLTLEEFSERVDRAWSAVTEADLDALVADLPLRVPPRRRPRLLVGILSSFVRAGRLRVGRRVVCLSVLGNVDLDLRDATFEHGRTTVLMLALVGTGDVYIPEHVDADVSGFVVLGHGRAHGRAVARRDADVVRVVAVGLFGGLDLWRVPDAWRDRSFGDVVKGISIGRHLELDP